MVPRALPVLSLLALLLLLAGCGSDHSAPTAPATPQPRYVIVYHWTITDFDALVDGDPIDGPGEFSFWVSLGSTQAQGIESQFWDRSLNTGESSALNFTWTWSEGYDGGPAKAIIAFHCTEWDADLLGNPVADSNMNDRHATATEILNPDAQVTNYITLGNDQCKVRLHYTVAVDTLAAN